MPEKGKTESASSLQNHASASQKRAFSGADLETRISGLPVNLGILLRDENFWLE
jgi:hypothetical protein